MSAPVLYPDLLIQVIPDTQVVTPGYLRHVWDSEEVRADVERRARTSAGIFKINQGNLAEVRVPLPDRKEQERVATRLDRHLAKSDEVRKSAEERLSAINNVPAALLRRAFSGEL
jgi:type I restriction enzyme S subunit